MTIDYKALAERLKAHAECHANVEPFDDEQRQWEDDLRTVVSLLEEMAEAKPVAWMHDGPPLHGEASITPEPDAWHEFSLYAHPAPQPQPEQTLAPTMPTHDPAMGVSLYQDEEQPERQPVSEPTDRCKHGVRFPHECKECADEPSSEEIQRWMESKGLGEREPQPTEAQIEAAADVVLAWESETFGKASARVFADAVLRAALAAKEQQ